MCSFNALKAVGGEPLVRYVDQCVKQSGGVDANNEMFNQQIRDRENKLVFILPTSLVNDIPYRGTLGCVKPVRPDTCGLFGAVCDGFKPDSRPDACTTTDGCPLGQVRDRCGICGGDHTSCKWTVGRLVLAGGCFFLLAFVIWYFYTSHQRLKRNLNEVATIYEPLLRNETEADIAGLGDRSTQLEYDGTEQVTNEYPAAPVVAGVGEVR